MSKEYLLQTVELMKLVAKLSASLLLTWAFICCAIVGSELFDRDTTRWQQQDSQDTILGGVALGLPALAGAGWLLWDASEKERTRRRQIFYQLLQNRRGKITVLQLAVAAQISGTAAKKFLDSQVRDFCPSFETSETGEIIYVFPSEGLSAEPLIPSDSSRAIPFPSPKPSHKKKRKIK